MTGKIVKKLNERASVVKTVFEGEVGKIGGDE